MQYFCINNFFESIRFLDFKILLTFFVLGGGLSFILLFINFIFSPRNPEKEKISPYECGFEPFSAGNIRFNVHYYIVAILFVIFDVEVIFLFPWVLSLPLIGVFSFAVFFIFFYILTFGFIMEWKNSLVRW